MTEGMEGQREQRCRAAEDPLSEGRAEALVGAGRQARGGVLAGDKLGG